MSGSIEEMQQDVIRKSRVQLVSSKTMNGGG